MKILRRGEPRPQLQKPIFIKLNQVGPYSTGCNLLVKILAIDEEQYKNFKGEIFKVRVVKVGDNTAVAILRLIKDQYCQLQVGSVIALRNTRINIVSNKLRLEIDTWGKITVQEDEEIESVNVDNNISNIRRQEKINQLLIKKQQKILLKKI